MGKNKCDTDKEIILKETHKFLCKKCGRSAKKKDKLCKPDKIDN